MKNLIKAMKKVHCSFNKIWLLYPAIIIMLGSSQVYAQVPKELPTTKSPAINAGSLLTQFANAIKPSSFIDKWTGEKNSWLSSVNKITGAPAMASSISSLAKYIKPTMFKEGFNLQNFLQTASKAKSMTEAAGLLKNLEGGLRPEAMVSSWAGKKDAWLSALKLLK